jgi:cbb3-type cytochrome oxidase subunit 3
MAADMKFEVRYPGGAVHEVVLDGKVAVIGRDPSCDLVIQDPRSSRRHAVVENGPDGLVIRDSASANGLTVNGTRTERAPLRPGDVVRIGEVEIVVLGEAHSGTLPMGDPDRTGSLRPQPAPDLTTGSLPAAPRLPPEAPPPRPVPPDEAGTRSMPPASVRPNIPVRAARGADRRPLTIAVLAVLWVLSIPFHALTGILLAPSWPGMGGVAFSIAAALFAIIAGTMAFGLWTAQGWARPAQIALAALGILNCPFALASLAVLVYMLRPQAKRYFSRAAADEGDQSEAVFAAALVAAVVLGGLITAGLTVVARTARTGVEVGYKP